MRLWNVILHIQTWDNNGVMREYTSETTGTAIDRVDAIKKAVKYQQRLNRSFYLVSLISATSDGK